MGNLVMVQHDDIHAALAEPINGGDGGGTTVHRQQQPDWKLLKTILHAVPGEAVSFIQPVWQVAVNPPAQRGQRFAEESGRSHAIHIVIPKKDQRFVPASREKQPVHGRRHVRHEEGVAELVQARFQEIGRAGGVGHTPVDQALTEQGRNPEYAGQLAGQQRLRRRDGPAKFHGRFRGCVAPRRWRRRSR
jgi:hypothetical protein